MLVMVDLLKEKVSMCAQSATSWRANASLQFAKMHIILKLKSQNTFTVKSGVKRAALLVDACLHDHFEMS